MFNKNKNWTVNFNVRQSKTIYQGEEIIDKNEARATIEMDFEQVMILLQMVNTRASFGLIALDDENFKTIVDDSFDPACWNDYYIDDLRSVDFDEKEIYINVYNY